MAANSSYGSLGSQNGPLSTMEPSGNRHIENAEDETVQPLLRDNDNNDTNENENEAQILSDDEEQHILGRESNENALSNCDTIIHLLKGNIGTGILAMPDAIKNSGLIVGNVGLVFMSMICVFCMHKLVKCSQELCRRVGKPKLKYAEVAELAFFTSGPTLRRFAGTARTLINIFLCITQLGFCCVYFVFVSQNLKLVFDHHFGSLDYHSYMAIILVPMLLLCSVRDLKYLAPVSMLANLLQFIGLGLIFFYLTEDLPYTWERKYWASWSQLPLYFGTAIYAFEGIGVVLPLENQMRFPSELKGWNGVLNTSMVIVSCLYIAVGFFGYLKYGDDVQGSITLNLPVHEWLAQIIIIKMSLAIFFSYGLQFYVALDILLPHVHNRVSERYHLASEFALRYGLVLFTFSLAAAIPKLDLFISLVGAVSSSSLALMAPAIIDVITYYPDLGSFKYRLWQNMFIFLIGFIGFLTGTYVSITKIIEYFTQ